MRKLVRPLVLLLLLCAFGQIGNAQTCVPCDAGVRTVTVDLTSKADTVWTITNLTRNGLCCGASGAGNNNCIKFVVTVNPSVTEVGFDVYNPAPPGGAFYQLNCGTPTSLGQKLCVSGQTSFCITFCKSGNDEPIYQISTSRGFGGSSDIYIRADGTCSDTIGIGGLTESTVVWNSIAPGVAGQYNSYLRTFAGSSSVNGNDTVLVRMPAGAPAFVDYQVCGTRNGCASGASSCDTIRVYSYGTLAVAMTPSSGYICTGMGGTVPITATPSGGKTPYTYSWTGPGGFTATTSSITASTAGDYIITVTDSTQCAGVSQTVTISNSPEPTITLGTNPTVCVSQSASLPYVGINGSPNQYTINYDAVAEANGFVDVAYTALPASPIPLTVPNNLAAGVYNAQIKVRNSLTGCESSYQSFTITLNGVTPGTIAAAQVVCSNGDPAAFTVSVAATGSGSLSYQWQSSTDNITYNNIAGATSATYDPPSGLATTTYYRRIVSSTLNSVNCNAISNAVTATINTVTAGTVAGSQTVCSGGNPAAYTVSVAATGAGTITYQWQSSTDNVSFSDIAGATGATYDVPSGLTVTTYYRRVATSTLSSVACSAISNTLTATVNDVSAGTVASDQTVCNAADPGAFTVGVGATGSGVLSYQWQSSSDNISFSNIAGATSATYDPPSGITATTYYRRIVTSSLNGVDCQATSNTVTVLINTVASGTIASAQTICSGGDPAAFTVSIAASGAGALSYQWQSSTDNSTFSNVAGATGATYDIPTGLAITTYYRRVVTSTLNSVTCSATSNTLTVSVNDVTAGTIAADQTVCSGGDPAAFLVPVAATGSGVLTYQWERSTDNITFSSIAGAISATYDPLFVLATTYYRRVVTSTLNSISCTATSNVVTVTVNDVTPGTIAADQTVCSSGDPASFTVSVAATGTGALTYQWQSSTDNVTFSNIAGATASAYNAPAGLLATTYYRRVTTSTLNSVNCSATSNVVTVTVNNVTAGTVASDQTICPGGDPAAFTASVAATGTGTLTYQWQSSPDNITFTNIAGATSATYNEPSGVWSTVYFRRIVTSTLNSVACTAISNTVTVTVNDVLAGTIASDQTVCNGGDPNVFTIAVAATGSGVLSYQWQSSTDNVTFVNIAGATVAIYNPPLGLTTTTYYRRIVTSTLNSISCSATSNTVTVFVNDVTAGTVASAQTICNGGDPAAFTTVLPATGSGALSYQWQSSPDNVTYSNIAGATSATYDPPTGVTVTTYYRRIVTSTLNTVTCSAISNTLTVTVNDITAGTISSDQTVCSGGNPSSFLVPVSATGSGTLTYQWQSSTDNITFSNIAGATSATYDAPAGLTLTTYYRRIATSTLNSVSCSATSNTLTVSVNDVTAGTVASAQTVCNGGDPAAFTVTVAATGTGAVSYQWQSSTDNVSFSNIAGATSSTYNPPSGLTVTTYYRRIATSTLNSINCSATSNVITVTINDVTAGTIAGDQTVCNGGDPAAYTVPVAATASGTLTYQWQSSADNTTFTDIVGATSATYNIPSGLTATTYYRRIATSTLNSVSCSATSNTLTITINDVTAGTITADQTICDGGDPATFAVGVAATGSGVLSYQWQSSTDNISFSNIAGAIASTYNPPSGLTTTTYYRRIVTSSFNSVTCSATSNTVTVTINDVTAGTVASGQTLCSGGDPSAFTVSVAATGSGALSYQWQSSTDNLTFSNIAGATSAAYDAPAGLTVTTYYRRLVTSTLNSVTCTAISNVLTVNINDVTAGTIATSQTLCAGGDPVAFTVAVPATGAGTLTYQWQASPDNITFSNIIGATSAAYDEPSGVWSTVYFRRIVTSTLNSVTCTAISNTISVTVNDVTAGAVASSQTLCNGGDPAAFTVAIAATGTGALTYQWQSSADNVTYSNIAGATAATYDAPSGVTSTIYYRRIVTSTLNSVSCSAISNIVTVTVNNVTPGTIAASQTICAGGDPAAFTVPVAATGAGTLTYQWQSSADNVTFSNIAGATSATYDEPSGVFSTTYFRRIVTSTLNAVTCTATSNTITVTVNDVTPGTVSSSQTICSAGDPASFTASVAATGSGTLSYQWQSSTDNVSFSNIAGATSATYDVPSGLTVTTYYRRIVTSTLNSVTCSATSNTVIATINDVTAGTIASSQTICNAGDAAAFTVSVAATGSGALTYQWQSSTDNITFSNIAGATSATYDEPAGLTVTTYYRRIVTSTLNTVTCSAISNTLTVTVNNVTAGTVATSQTICSAADPAAFTVTVPATGAGTLTYQWQSSTDNVSFSNIAGAVSATYDAPGGLLTTTYYRRIVTSTLNSVTCTATSNTITVTINDVTAGTVASSQTLCNGGDPAAFTVAIAATGTGALTYQWQSSTDNVTFSNIAGATSATYNVPSGLTVTTYYRRVVTSTLNSVSCSATSNTLTVSINNVTAGTIAASQTICSAGDPASFSVPVAATGTGVLTYQWQSSADNVTFTDIPGATSASYDVPGGLTTTTYYRRLVTSTLNSTTCTATSNTISVTVNDVTAGVIAASQTICNGGDAAAFTITTAATGTGTLTYQWQSSSDNVTFSNIAGATSANYDVPSGLTTTTFYRRVVTSTLNAVTCSAISNTLTVTINDVTPGTIASPQTVCSGGEPSSFTVVVPATGSGTLTYQWQRSTDNVTFTNIAGATGAIFDEPANLTVTTYYRRVVTSTLNAVTCSATSNTLTVTVNDVTAGTIGAAQTICNGGEPSSFTVIVPATGSGTLTYQWQISTDNVNFTNIPGATGAVYDESASLTVTTYYRRIVTSTLNSVTCSAISNVLTVTINDVTAGTVASSQTVCNGGDATAFTVAVAATGSGALSYQWQSSTDNVTFSNIPGATSATYDAPSGLTVTTYYRRVVTSTLNSITCSAISNTLIVNVNNVTAGTIAASQTICAGGDPAAFTVSVPATGAGTLTYQWQASSDNVSFSNIAGATSATYDEPSGTWSTTYFRRIVTSTLNSVTCTAISNTITVTVNDVTAGVIAASQTICDGGDPASFTITTAATGSGTLTYQWQSSTDNVTFTNIGGATSANYDVPSGLITTTFYRRIVTSTLNSVSCTAISNTLTVTINDVTPGTIASNQTICNGGEPSSFSVVVPATGSGTLTYQWQNSTDNVTFTNIAGATGVIFDDPSNLTVTTYYRRVVTSTLNAVTCSAISNVLTVTVNNVTAGTIAASQTVCASGDPAAFTVTVPATGSGTLTYQWQSSTDNVSFSNIAGATSATYDEPSGLTVTTYFRRIVTSTLNSVTCSATSNTISVTVNDVTAGTIAASQTICSAGDPGTFTVAVAATGSGTLTYQWQSSTDNVTFSNIPGATSATFDVPSGLTVTTYYRRVVTSTLSSVACTATSNTVVVTINNVTAGTIATNQTICSAGDPATFTVTVPATGSGILTYQWQSSSDNISFSNIAGATSATYDEPGGLTTTTYYRRVVTSTLNSVTCSATSNTIQVTINDVTAGVIAASQTVCDGGDAAPFSITTAATGSGTLTYQWQSSTDNVTFSNIVGATSAGYDAPGGLTTTTYYRRIVTSTLNSVSCSAISNTLTVTINDVTAGTIATSQTICSAGDPSTFTIAIPATGSGTLSYQWQSSTDNVAFTNIAGATSATYDAPAGLTFTTYYRRIVTSTLNSVTCSATSNTLTVTINNVTAGTIAASQTVCAAGDPAAFTIAAPATGSGTLTYQWQSSTDNINFSNIAGATLATYDEPSGLIVTTYFRRIVTSTLNSVTCSATSNTISVTVNDVTAGTVAASQTICSAGDPGTFTVAVAATGSGTLTYQWQSSTDNVTFTNISGATSATFDVPSGLTVTTYYRRVVTSTLSSVACTATSNTVVVTINNVTAGTIATNQTVCSAGDPDAFGASVAATGSGTLTYQWQSSTDNINFTDIPGATSSGYDAPAGLTVLTYYRRIVTSTLNSVSCSATSNVISVTVNDVTPGTIGSNQAHCSGGDPTPFTVLTSATGSGTLSYQWQSSTDNINFTNIAGANSATYDVPAGLPVTTYFRRLVTSDLSGMLCTVASNTVTVVMNATQSVSVGANPVICQREIAAFLPYNIMSGTPDQYSIDFDATANAAGLVDVVNSALTPGSVTIPVPVNIAAGTYNGVFVARHSVTGCLSTPVAFTIKINPSPEISSVAADTTCSGVLKSYMISSAVPNVNFTWDRAAVVGISNPGATGQTSNPIQETLINTTTSPIPVTYIITPVSTDGCTTATPFTRTLTVMPSPVITSAASDVKCSGEAQNYDITSGVSGTTYTWSRPLVAGISNPAVTGQTTNKITEALINTTSSAIVVPYTIVPMSPNGCTTATPFTYSVTINPSAEITSASSDIICSGVQYSYTISSWVPNSTFTWSRPAVAGISNAAVAGQASNPIQETLINTTALPVNVIYNINGVSPAGCGTLITHTLTVTVNPSPVITSSATTQVCSGVDLNYDIVSPVGGTGFTWSRAAVPGISNAAVSGQTADPITEVLVNTTNVDQTVTYIITPMSPQGCTTAAPFPLTVTVHPSPVITSLATHQVCSGSPVGYDIVSAVGNSTFTWSRAAVAGISNAAVSGQTGDPIMEVLVNTTSSDKTVTYIITATSPDGCTTAPPFPLTVVVHPSPEINSSATHQMCSGTAVNYDITSAVDGVSYTWSRAAVPGISNAAVSGQTADPIMEVLVNTTSTDQTVTYIITPTSTDGCSTAAPFPLTVTVHPAPTITSASTRVVCSGTEFNYDIVSAVPNPSFTWSRAAVPGISNPAVTGQTSDPIIETLNNTTTSAVFVTYLISPLSQDGCTTATPFPLLVKVNPAPTITSAATKAICSREAVNYQIQSGVSGTTYSWSRATVAGISNPGVSNVAGDFIGETLTNTTTSPITVTYIIIPTTPDGCTITPPFSLLVAVNPSPEINSVASKAICTGDLVDYTISSAVNNTSYTWSRAAVPGISNPAVSGQSANPIMETLTNTTTSPVNVTYIITPMSADGCTSAAPFPLTVTVNPAPVITSSATGSTCSGELFSYQMVSGVTGTTFVWSRAAVSGISNAAVSGQSTGDMISETLVNTTAAPVQVTYIIVPTSPNGCTITPPFPLVVTVNPSPVITSSATGQVCSGVAQNYDIVSPVSGVTFTWSRAAVAGISNPALSNQNTGTKITEVLNNTTTSNVTVTYIITPSTVPGCTTAAPFPYVVTVKPLTAKPVVGSNSPVCAGSPINLTASDIPGASYFWYGPNGFVSNQKDPVIPGATPAAAGQYTVSATINGCVSEGASVDVVVNSIPATTDASSNSPICGVGNTILLSATVVPGATYTWTGPNGFTSNLREPSIPNAGLPNAGKYYVTTTILNCTSQADSTEVIIHPTFPATPSTNSPICSGSQLELNSPNIDGETYKWTGPNGFLSTLQSPRIPNANTSHSGQYFLTIYWNGCASAPVAVDVVVNPTPATPVVISNSPVCSGNPISLSTTTVAGGSYAWTGPNGFTTTTQNLSLPNATTAMTGNYNLVVTVLNCPSLPAVTPVVVNQTPTAVTPTNNGPLCLGSRLDLSAPSVPGGSYAWTGPNGFVSNQQFPSINPTTIANAGQYSVIVSVQNCPSPSSSTNVIISNQPTTATAGSYPPVCANLANVVLNGTVNGGMGTGAWSTNGSGTFTPSNTDLGATYIPSPQDITNKTVTLTLTSTNNGVCAASTSSTVISITDSPLVDAGVDLAMCSNDPTIQLDGSVLGASGGIWTTNGTGNFTPSATAMSVVYNPSTGDRVRTSLYAILTSTGNGICKAVSDTVVFTIIPAPTVDAGPDLAILEDEIVTLNPTVTGSNLSYVWSPGSYLSNTTVKNPQATGIDDITYTLTVKGTGGCEASDDLNILVLRPFIVPNTFTPNGDGVNDKWSIPKLSTYAGCKVQIFDRYGQLVFQSVGYWEPWDGKFKGKPLPVGTYYYIIETGKRKPLTGYVQILK